MTDHPDAESRHLGFIGKLMIFGAFLALGLVGYGAIRIPGTNLVSIAGAAAVLLAYAAIGYQIVPHLSRARPAVMQVATWVGLAAGAVFAAEICLEYVLLPHDNTSWGFVEFGLVFALYACAGIWLTIRQQKWRDAMIGSVLSAVVSSIIWCVVLLAVFHLFYGTDRQHRVFEAEGDFDDFRKSGMHDFEEFIMEDLLGATFFHLLLGPAMASVLGLGGVGVGKLLTSIFSAGPRRTNRT